MPLLNISLATKKTILEGLRAPLTELVDEFVRGGTRNPLDLYSKVRTELGTSVGNVIAQDAHVAPGGVSIVWSVLDGERSVPEAIDLYMAKLGISSWAKLALGNGGWTVVGDREAGPVRFGTSCTVRWPDGLVEDVTVTGTLVPMLRYSIHKALVEVPPGAVDVIVAGTLAGNVAVTQHAFGRPET